MQARLPSFQSIFQVYAVIVFMFSAWTITAFLWKLSAWLMILNLGEILTIFSYGMVVNFVESLLVLLALLGLSFLLPSAVLRDDFIVRGSILAAGIVGSVMASFQVESFSLDRVRGLRPGEIEERYAGFRRLTEFGDFRR